MPVSFMKKKIEMGREMGEERMQYGAELETLSQMLDLTK